MNKDLDLKAFIYATAGIREYWVVDLSANQMIVFRDPQNSQYTTKQTIRQGVIRPLAFPEIQVSVEKLLV